MSDSILQRVASGESGAASRCLDRYAPLVWSIARRYASSASDAEDAVQEVFVEVWKNAARFDPAIAGEATFIAMIARRRCIDRRRRHARDAVPTSLSEEMPARPAPRAFDDEQVARAHAALKDLSPEQQRVIHLSIHRGLTHEQVASATGLPLGTVKTHIRRGLIRVREALSGATGVSA